MYYISMDLKPMSIRNCVTSSSGVVGGVLTLIGSIYFKRNNSYYHNASILAFFIAGIILDVVAIISFCNKPQGQVSYNQLRQAAVV